MKSKLKLDSVSIWLLTVCVMILCIVVIGGVTRLTQSGLSMVDWRPLMGALPPMSPEEWNEVFLAYQASPQYTKVNLGMSLSEFKFIFFWEYFHRLFARSIGLVYFFPFIYFMLRKNFSRTFKIQLTVGFLLGGLQGVVGWLMVKSGLVDNPQVSHIRLAIHFGLAVFVLVYLFRIVLFRLNFEDVKLKPQIQKKLFCGSLALVGLVSVQMIYGAFTAGLKAGHLYNTFPKMDGSWVPPLDKFLALLPAWSNFIDNPTTVQWVHRTMGWMILFTVLAFVVYAVRLGRKGLPRHIRASVFVVAAMTVLQFSLGVSTLLLNVPITLGVAHQLGGCLLLLSVVFLNHSLRRTR